MRHCAGLVLSVVAMLVFGAIGEAWARETLVRSEAEFASAMRAARPGATILLADGVWRDFEMLVDGEGAPDKPITVAAQTPGAVILSGRSNLRLGGRHLVVKGLVFRDGFSPTGEVISFRKDSKRNAFDSRVTEVVIDRFNKPSRSDNEIWVALFGRNNRVDHSHFEGKLTSGVTLAVRLDAPDSNQNAHRIDHNYFGPRPPLGSNGGETIRIGTSHNSLEDSATVVENNFFEEASGEIEIISNKSGANVYRGNVFYRSQGALTLRHGNGNLVERNVFIGGGVPNTGGVRVINADQTVRDNYFIDLEGGGFAGALVVMNAVPNSPLNRYHQVRRAKIHNNTFVDVSEVTFGAGADEERSLAPADSVIADNLFIGAATRFRTLSDMSGLAGSNNIVSGAEPPRGMTGFVAAQVAASRGDAFALPAITPATEGGARWSGKIITREEVGAPWQAKPARDIAARARSFHVGPGVDVIAQTLANARGSAELVLAPGRYLETRTIEVTSPVILRAAVAGQAKVEFEAPTLFSLSEDAEIALQGLTIRAPNAPDAYGNSVIRARPSTTGYNYAIRLSGSSFEDLDVNRGFAVVRAERGAFIGRLSVEDARFERISGPVFALHGESENSGVYNVEEISVRASRFTKIAGGAFDVFRGGGDESTFGPRLYASELSFDGVGPRDGPSAQLEGVQRLELDRVQFRNSGAMRFVVNAGAPSLTLDGATYDPQRGDPRIDFIDKRG